MTGERMNKIYAQVCMNIEPTLESEEEREFYNLLKKEIEEKEAGKPIEWAIPAE